MSNEQSLVISVYLHPTIKLVSPLIQLITGYITLLSSGVLLMISALVATSVFSLMCVTRASLLSTQSFLNAFFS